MVQRFEFLTFLLGIGLVALAGLLFGTPGPTLAQAPDRVLEEEMYRIADKLNCPICQGQRLSECPIQICQEMRAEITQRLQEGQDESEIIQAFVDRYGIQALNQPPVEGFNILAWAIPFVGLAVVLVVGGWVLRGWLRPRPTAPVET
ncbi:MAG: cytochrome c-type biogenesis protein CcmH, partial [Anaerolineae bacterium]